MGSPPWRSSESTLTIMTWCFRTSTCQVPVSSANHPPMCRSEHASFLPCGCDMRCSCAPVTLHPRTAPTGPARRASAYAFAAPSAALSAAAIADMDGFKLLEHVNFELNLPVISELPSHRTSPPCPQQLAHHHRFSDAPCSIVSHVTLAQSGWFMLASQARRASAVLRG